jgi:quercetin dioxygenase-like cupin family protein
MKKTLIVVAAVLAVPLCPGVAAAQIPTSQVVLDNPSVRVTVLTFPPGGATGRHSGIEAEIGMVVEGELTLDSPTGRQTLRAGAAYWLPGLTPHDLRNEGKTPAKLWDILLKRCD